MIKFCTSVGGIHLCFTADMRTARFMSLGLTTWLPLADIFGRTAEEVRISPPCLHFPISAHSKNGSFYHSKCVRLWLKSVSDFCSPGDLVCSGNRSQQAHPRTRAAVFTGRYTVGCILCWGISGPRISLSFTNNGPEEAHAGRWS